MNKHEYTVFYPAENMWAFAVFDDVYEALEYVDEKQLTILFRNGITYKMFWPMVRQPTVIEAVAVYAS